jgi:hypothetical protein
MIVHRKREAAPCSLNGAVTASLKLEQNYKMTQFSLQTLNTPELAGLIIKKD